MLKDGGEPERRNRDRSYGDYERHPILVHVGYVVVVTIIAAIVEYIWLWPEYHLVALLIAAAYFSTIAVVEMVVWGFRASYVTATVLCLFGLAFSVFWWVGPAGAPEAEIGGTLQAGNMPTPPNGCDHAPFPVPPNALKVLVGTNAFVHAGNGRFRAIQVAQCPVVSMERTDKGISVSAILYDSKGRLIAKITRDRIDAISGGDVTVSRDGDLSRLIVRRGDSTLLAVRYLNPTTVEVAGKFGCPGHAPVEIQPNRPILGAALSNSCMGATAIGMFIQ
jgi:hypothetical protein